MSYQQLVTPNPNITCWPGMCLQYVRQAFGAPLVEPTATDGWNKAKYKHADRNFPDGVWVPLWFAIPGIPAGHVALRAPDGSVYSTSDNSNTPHHHPSLDELIWYYGPRVQPQYQLELQYLGWSEDISTVRVVQEFALATESINTSEEDDMPSANEIAKAILDFRVDAVTTGGQINLGQFLAEARLNNNKIVETTSQWILPEVIALRELVKQLSVKQGVTIDYDAIAKAVNDDAAARMKG
jgi:hypothetical protein